MKAGELFDLFRLDVNDVEEPYLWTEDEVWAYMNDAYRMFVRLTGGIPDTTSELTRIPLAAGKATSRVSPLILRFRTAYLKSNGRELTIINDKDEPLVIYDDYGFMPASARNTTPGQVHYMLIGRERDAMGGLVQWVRIPDQNDTAILGIYRLPLDTVDGSNPDFDFYEIGEEHHFHLLDWMKKRAHEKQDAETFDRGKSNEFELKFRSYCAEAKAEWERYKAKVHVVEYGGL